MPKYRAKTNFKKRFKVTKNGKVRFKSLGSAKYQARKTSARKRRLGKAEILQDTTQAKKIKTILGE